MNQVVHVKGLKGLIAPRAREATPMKEKFIYLLLIAGLLIGTNRALAAERYLCIADMTAGFAFDDKEQQWRRANFPIAKYIVSKASKEDLQYISPAVDEDAGVWIVREMGASHPIPISVCWKGFEKTLDKNDEAHCEGAIDFKMGRRLSRFIAVVSNGYWKHSAMSDEKYFSPNMSLGTCTAL